MGRWAKNTGVLVVGCSQSCFLQRHLHGRALFCGFKGWGIAIHGQQFVQRHLHRRAVFVGDCNPWATVCAVASPRESCFCGFKAVSGGGLQSMGNSWRHLHGKAVFVGSKLFMVGDCNPWATVFAAAPPRESWFCQGSKFFLVGGIAVHGRHCCSGTSTREMFCGSRGHARLPRVMGPGASQAGTQDQIGSIRSERRAC